MVCCRAAGGLIACAHCIVDCSRDPCSASWPKQKHSWLLLQAFAELPRERLIALSVFCHSQSVPAGSVLASQGDVSSRIFLIKDGTVAHVLEGEDTGNPLAPALKQATDSVLGQEFVSAGSAAGMRAALDRRNSSLGGAASTARCGFRRLRLQESCADAKRAALAANLAARKQALRED